MPKIHSTKCLNCKKLEAEIKRLKASLAFVEETNRLALTQAKRMYVREMQHIGQLRKQLSQDALAMALQES